MADYTFQELINMPIGKLIKLRDEKRQELKSIRDEKAVVCGNIVSLQGMIAEERHPGGGKSPRAYN